MALLQDGNQHKQEQKTWEEFPDDIVLSIIARLPWDKICGLFCIWKNLYENWTLYQMIFEEYSGARFQKPIGLFHGFVQSLPSTPILEGAKNEFKLTFSVIAGDGYPKPHNLIISQFRDVPIVRGNALGRFTQESNFQLKTTISCRAAGCFVLLWYSSYNASYKGPFDRIQESSPTGQIKSSPVRSGWIVMNPANGTARQIEFPSHPIPIEKGRRELLNSRPSLHGIFEDEGSHYQILASSYFCNQHGHYRYMEYLPPDIDEDLGMHEHGFYNTFFLYKSITKSWTKLLGSNICILEILYDAVLYQGIIHAMLSREKNRLSSGVKYVDEISGIKRWMPLSIPLPPDEIFYAHLFVFQGTLMIAGAVLCSTRMGLENVFYNQSLPRSVFRQHVWRLHEASRSWVEVGRTPNHILNDMLNRSCCFNFWQAHMRLSASGGYVMAGGGCVLDPVNPDFAIHPQCMVVYNIVTNHWQIAHVHSPMAAPVTNQTLSLFEPRFDISA